VTHKEGKNQDDLQRLNRSLVMRLIHKNELCSRAELAKQSGLTKASITVITQQLIDAGVVKEVGLIGGEKGRRSIGLTLEMDRYLCIGIRLTRQNIHGGLFDIAGEIYAEEERAITDKSTPGDAINLIKDVVHNLMARADARAILGIGLALPGPIIYEENSIAFMSAFPGWENINVKEILYEEFHMPILLEHDALCFALSEWRKCDQDDYRLLLCVLAGQGVGAGIIDGGRPVRGALGCAGEIGHMSLNPSGPRCDCGNYGCMENYASTLALEREMALALQSRPDHPMHGTKPHFQDIVRAVKAGDELAVRLFTRAGEYLGYGLVNLINFLNPDIVIVTDSLAECTELLQTVLQDTLAQRLSPKILARTKLVVKPSDQFQALKAATSLIVDLFLDQPMLTAKRSET